MQIINEKGKHFNGGGGEKGKMEKKLKKLCEACTDGEHGECFYGFNWGEQQCLCGCKYPKGELSDADLEAMAERSYQKHLPVVREMMNEFHRPEKPKI